VTRQLFSTVVADMALVKAIAIVRLEVVSHSQTIISCLFEGMRTTLHIWSDFDPAPQTVVQIFGSFGPFWEMPNVCRLTATSDLAKPSCPFVPYRYDDASSSNGATYNQQNFTAQWNTSASYAPQLSPTSSLNTMLEHTASPPAFTTFLHQRGNENV
jgi:hypothetical protein